VPAIPPYIIEPIWEQFSALLPEREVHHPLGCHRSRIPDRVVFNKLVQALVFGCAYRRIADDSCSVTTLRERRDEWIACGVIEKLRQVALDAYDRMIGLQLAEVAVDGCIAKAPCGGEKAGKSPVIGKTGHQALHGGGWAGHPHRRPQRPRKPPRFAAFGPYPRARQGVGGSAT
jgi:transposase